MIITLIFNAGSIWHLHYVGFEDHMFTYVLHDALNNSKEDYVFLMKETWHFRAWRRILCEGKRIAEQISNIITQKLCLLVYLHVVRTQYQPTAECEAGVDEHSAQQKASYLRECCFKSQYHNLRNTNVGLTVTIMILTFVNNNRT
jgi:hypothetical protein